MARVHLIIKYTFLVIIVLGAGLTIERLTGIKRWWMRDSRPLDDLVYNASSPLAYWKSDRILSKNYWKCLTRPTKPFCLLSANKRLELFGHEQGDVPTVEEVENRLENISFELQPRTSQIHSLLVTFSGLMKSNDVKVLLIEPSMLYCLLSPDKKFNMLKTGFNPGRLQGSRNVVTVGVFSKDSKKLEKTNTTSEVLSAGFKIMKFRKWIGEDSEKSFETVHYFFSRQDVAVHVVIFYPRNTYLWHAGLDPEEVGFKDLLFVNDGIFENFTFLPLNLDGTSISRTFLPNDFRYFMKEIESSRFVECKANSSSVSPFLKHPNLSLEQLNTRAVIALKELKMILAPQMVIFWLWSKTLLGWLAKCDIFHYSSTLELAVAYRSIEDLEFFELLDETEFLNVANDTESDSDIEYRLECHGLVINISILHEDENSHWFKRREGRDTQKYFFVLVNDFAKFGKKEKNIDVFEIELMFDS